MTRPQLSVPTSQPARLMAMPLAAAGAVVTALAVAGPINLAGVRVAGTVAPVRAMLVACAVSLALSIFFMPTRADRLELLGLGLAALGGVSILAMSGDPLVAAILLVLLGAMHATRPSPRSFAERLRNPGMAAVLLGLGSAFLDSSNAPVLGRVGVVGLVLGLVAAAGLAPYLHRFDPGEPTSSSGLAWTGFIAPVLALALVGQVVPRLHPIEATVFSAICLGLGLGNLGWGLLGAWRAPDAPTAWRRAFLADWGLALVGFGLVTPSRHGLAGAYLVLLALVLVRLPLYLYARSAMAGDQQEQRGAINLLAGLALAGAAPFAGFAARLLLLEAAMGVAWPLAAVLLLAMVAWFAHSFRLGASLGRPRQRTVVGLALVLALSAAVGIVPGVALTLGGLG